MMKWNKFALRKYLSTFTFKQSIWTLVQSAQIRVIKSHTMMKWNKFALRKYLSTFTFKQSIWTLVQLKCVLLKCGNFYEQEEFEDTKGAIRNRK
jgi:hypothetical protein